jgi:integrase
LLVACAADKQPGDRLITRYGKPINDFRRVWARVSKAAGVPDLLFHDLRRSGARTMRRLGMYETTIMRIGGWRTRSVFARYAIVDERDLQDAARVLDERQKRLVADSHKTSHSRHRKRCRARS